MGLVQNLVLATAAVTATGGNPQKSEGQATRDPVPAVANELSGQSISGTPRNTETYLTQAPVTSEIADALNRDLPPINRTQGVDPYYRGQVREPRRATNSNHGGYTEDRNDETTSPRISGGLRNEAPQSRGSGQRSDPYYRRLVPGTQPSSNLNHGGYTDSNVAPPTRIGAEERTQQHGQPRDLPPPASDRWTQRENEKARIKELKEAERTYTENVAGIIKSLEDKYLERPGNISEVGREFMQLVNDRSLNIDPKFLKELNKQLTTKLRASEDPQKYQGFMVNLYQAINNSPVTRRQMDGYEQKDLAANYKNISVQQRVQIFSDAIDEYQKSIKVAFGQDDAVEIERAQFRKKIIEAFKGVEPEVAKQIYNSYMDENYPREYKHIAEILEDSLIIPDGGRDLETIRFLQLATGGFDAELFYGEIRDRLAGGSSLDSSLEQVETCGDLLALCNTDQLSQLQQKWMRHRKEDLVQRIKKEANNFVNPQVNGAIQTLAESAGLSDDDPIARRRINDLSSPKAQRQSETQSSIDLLDFSRETVEATTSLIYNLTTDVNDPNSPSAAELGQAIVRDLKSSADIAQIKRRIAVYDIASRADSNVDLNNLDSLSEEVKDQIYQMGAEKLEKLGEKRFLASLKIINPPNADQIKKIWLRSHERPETKPRPKIDHESASSITSVDELVQSVSEEFPVKKLQIYGEYYGTPSFPNQELMGVLGDSPDGIYQQVTKQLRRQASDEYNRQKTKSNSQPNIETIKQNIYTEENIERLVQEVCESYYSDDADSEIKTALSKKGLTADGLKQLFDSLEHDFSERN